VPDVSPQLDKYHTATDELEDRLTFLQNLVGQLSRNISQVPGKLVKEQWDRHWAQQWNGDLVGDSSLSEESSYWGWLSALAASTGYRLLQGTLLTVLVFIVILTTLTVTHSPQ